ncbi:MAG TPA: acyltransferase [Caulobacteraceae bacterium]|nr:acyltransferase [Caulobacteraceae bacterium]
MGQPINLKPLTSLRFFAAMWVVLYHYWPNLAVAGMPTLVAKGYLGVECFFVLSGFILCHVYLAAFEDGRFHYADFLWTRLARIYPMHLATLVGVGLLGGLALAAGLAVDPNVVALSALPANLALVQAWGFAPVAGWNHPSWSISAEWFAYLLFPAFALAAVRLRRRPGLAVLGAVALTCALYAWFPLLSGISLTSATIAWGALRIVPPFAIGCALFLLWRTHEAKRRASLAGAAIFGALALSSARFEAPDALTVAAFGGLIISLAQASRAGSRVGSNSVAVYLGEISYSIYMVCIPWQLIFVNLATRFLHLPSKHLPLALWVIYVAALIPLAAVAHHLIERPSRERMRLWWALLGTHELAT